MITRRSLLVGTAAVAGTVVLGGTARAACGPDLELRASDKLAVTIRSRAGWGADESYRFKNGVETWPAEFFRAQAVTVHHIGYNDGDNPAATLRNVYKDHAITQNFGDIGHHLLIDWTGVVYEGRYSGDDCGPVFNPARAVVNAGHVTQWNAGNIGVCLLHNLSVVKPTQAALDSLARTVATLCAMGGLDPLSTVKYVNPVNGKTKSVPALSGHRDWVSTDCPGTLMSPLLPDVRTKAKALMG